MGLSYDLISEFVKITNDKKDDKKEGTVYATVVSGTGGKYVRIDGSDLLTPMDTTTDIEDGERVTLMIKDHKAIVTGNVTTPSASTSKVDKVTESINSVSDRVGTFELVVADKVSTNELEAYKATIEVLVASKATIEDLTATNAKIENLEVKNAEIENLVAEKATIEDLEAVNATIENLKVKDAEIENAVVENLKATTADIKILNADFAQIKTLVNGNLTSDNILSFNLTSGKVTVDDAFIKDAMIDTISAGKINAGEINTNLVSIGSEDGGMLITGSTQQFTDKNGNVRIQIGKDTSGDFTFILYGEDGKGQLINQNGITASAISDGLIVNDMVSDNAAISGGKLDISSVITEINSDDSTTIKSSKIYLNEQAQSLEVAFNSLKTKVDTIQEVTIQGDLTAIVEQVQSNTSKIEANKDSINTLISQDTIIKKQVTDLQGTLNETETTLNSKYTSLSQNLDGFKTTVADTYATKKSVTDVVDNIEANYSTTSVMNSAIEQKAQEISASVSSTYATKNQVNTLDNNLKSNYSTTQQMESAINVAKEEINLGVSSIYETKENTTSKITGAINDLKIGGSNLITKKSNFVYGYISASDGVLSNIGSLNVNQDFYTTEFIFMKSGTPITFTSYPKQGVTSTIQNAVYIHFYNTDKVWQRCISNITSADTVASKTYTTVDDCYVRFCSRGFNDYNHMAEFATKPSEWTPAPEDIESDISTAKQEAITSSNNTLTTTISNYYTKSQTDSQINVAKEAINLGVSQTYETKTNVETKVTSTLNSAKSYADTKKSEAINTAASDATTKANTAKSEAIKSANNTLTSTISNYYTKAQTDSQINIAKEAINLGVSSIYETKANVETKINGVTIGGTNLLLNSHFDYDRNWSKGTAVTRVQEGVDGGYCMKTVGALKSTRNFSQGVSITKLEKGQQYTATVWIKTQDVVRGTTNPLLHLLASYTLNDEWVAECALSQAIPNGTTAWTKYVLTFTMPTVDFDVMLVSGYARDFTGTIWWDKIKIEKGNKATDWNPSPLDISTDITNAKTDAINAASTDATNKVNSAKNELNTAIGKKANSADVYTKTQVYTKDETNSQINVAKEAINLGVSTNYETKKNVETKVTSTLNSAKSYADTKKSEAISTAATDATSKANTAKQEAITSANNTLTSTIANYYTKSQTDSQINIAKEAINLGVSTTYETKTNVESKINNIQIGGTNLILNSDFEYDGVWAKESGVTRVQEGVDGGYCFKTVGSLNKQVNFHQGIPVSKLEKGEKYTATIWIKTKDVVRGTTNPHLYFFLSYYEGDTWKGELPLSTAIPNGTTPWTKYVLTFTMPTPDYDIVSIQGYARDFTGTIWWDKIKIEKGNKATDWNPAPEDISNNISTAKSEAIASASLDATSKVNAAKTELNKSIDKKANSSDVYTKSEVYTKSQTDSQIKITKDEINLGVSNDMESKFSSIESETKSIKQTVSSLVLGTDSISASVKSLEESMINTTNGLANDISNVQDQVNLAMTSADVKLEIQKEMSKGTNKVTTSTGFTFNENGLNISKTDSEMKTQITEDGMKIYKNSEVMLTANNQGVDAKNLHATTYLIIGNNSRMEDFTENGSERTAVFWIG